MTKRPTAAVLFSAALFLSVVAHSEEPPADQQREEIKAACVRMTNTPPMESEQRISTLLMLGVDRTKADAINKMFELPTFRVEGCVAQIEKALDVKPTPDPAQ